LHSDSSSKNGCHVGTASHEACIGLGSNLGRSLDILQLAWEQLGNHPAIIPVALSSPYSSRPVGMISTHWFVNAVALIRTTLPPHDLLGVLQAIETRCGRIRPAGVAGYQDRTLDLDLLLYDDRIVRSRDLEIPHPRMLERLFVLIPLNEIAGDRLHPLAQKKVRDLLYSQMERDDHETVEQISWPK
jgi:2-amino-4-hydroxy-6-hydroxymethyldihydropteridine diphosphokinase